MEPIFVMYIDTLPAWRGTLADFCQNNGEDREAVDSVACLGAGETCTLGGGAHQTAIIQREV